MHELLVGPTESLHQSLHDADRDTSVEDVSQRDLGQGVGHQQSSRQGQFLVGGYCREELKVEDVERLGVVLGNRDLFKQWFTQDGDRNVFMALEDAVELFEH